MTTKPPTVTITRTALGEVTATGGDELAVTLIRRAGFERATTPFQLWYRLPFDRGEQWENKRATYAALMLAAARYDVDFDPGLDTGEFAWQARDRPVTPTDPQGVYAAGRALLALTDQLNASADPADAARVTRHILDPDDGALERVRQYLEAAAEWCVDRHAEDGLVLADRFEQAAEQFSQVAADLTGIGEDLRELAGPPDAATVPAPGQDPAAARVQAARGTSPATDKAVTDALSHTSTKITHLYARRPDPGPGHRPR